MAISDNPGIEIIGDANEELRRQPRTLVVLGVSRGGTSATAGILGQLGVFMGNSGKAPMYEDLFLNRAVVNDSSAETEQRIEQYNTRHPVWGFKGVVLNRDLARYHRMFRSPMYLVIYRDLLAIASRARISAGHDIQKIMARQINEYGRIQRFLSEVNPPAILLSYEKMRQQPAAMIEAIVGFTGLQCTSSQLGAAVDFVTESQTDYLHVSRFKADPL